MRVQKLSMNGLLFFFLFFASSLGLARTICTITINSSDEKQIFQTRLRQTDPQIQFVELTTQGDSSNWFKKACESGVQCDSLIISGHFARTFFSEQANGLQMSTEEMQAASCSNKCDGIFKQPKEVYMFGCNTLASPGPDHRTPAQYKQVLLDSGFSEINASTIVACRYKDIGCSSQEKMQKIFPNVPLILGFDSTSPLGIQSKASVNQQLSRSLRRDGTYSQRLNKLEAAKVMSSIQEMNQRLSGYRADWTQAFAGQSASYCSGTKNSSRDQCLLTSPRSTQSEKLQAAERLMNSNERKQHFFEVKEFLSTIDPVKLTEDDKATILQIANNEFAKKEFKQVFLQVQDVPHLRQRLAGLGHRLGWLSEAEYQTQIGKFMGPYNAKGYLTQQDYFDASSVGPFDLRLKDLNRSLLENPTYGAYGLDMVGASRTSDPEMAQYLFERAQRPSAFRNPQLNALAKLRGPTNRNVDLYSDLLQAQDLELQSKSLLYLPQLPFDSGITSQVYNLTLSSNPTTRSQAWSALKLMSQNQEGFNDSDVITEKLIDRYLSIRSSRFDKSDAEALLRRLNLKEEQLNRIRVSNPKF
jgi:hypothetical protein